MYQLPAPAAITSAGTIDFHLKQLNEALMNPGSLPRVSHTREQIKECLQALRARKEELQAQPTPVQQQQGFAFGPLNGLI